mmetsp:Transcript_24519/g.53109  ORF Transcript_24519/g.53109 Transcript_24519/m.53109 type:complete len:81 (-) Transcript_24519:66-308(-)
MHRQWKRDTDCRYVDTRGLAYNERKGWIRKEVTVPSLYPEGYLASTVCGTGRVDFVLASSISERRANIARMPMHEVMPLS